MMIKNKMVVICVLFTLLTLVSSSLNIMGDTANLHILLRFSIVALAIGSLYIFDWLKELPLYAVHGIHYAVTMIAVFIIVWLTGFFVPLHPDAYRDIWLNFTAVYLAIVAVELVYLRVKVRGL